MESGFSSINMPHTGSVAIWLTSWTFSYIATWVYNCKKAVITRTRSNHQSTNRNRFNRKPVIIDFFSHIALYKRASVMDLP